MPLTESKYIWMDGEFIPWKEAKIHILSHVVHYGSAVFEGIRCYKTEKGPAIFRLKEHIDRLYFSASIYHMKIPYTKEQLINACKEIVKANGLQECYIRPIVYRGYGEMGVNPLNLPVKVAIAAWVWGPYLGKAKEEGARVIISTWRRFAPDAIPSMAKSSGPYMNNQLAKIEAVERGVDEAIMLDYRGFVSEGTGENIFIIKNNILYTPPLEASILPGITRDSIIKIAKDLKYTVIEKDLTRAELYHADEVFFTGTAAEVTPIVEIDGIKIGNGKPGPITRKLQEIFFKIAKGEEEKYLKWLTYVK